MLKGPIILSTVAIVFLFATGQPAYAWLVLAVLVVALIYKFFEAMKKGSKSPSPKPFSEQNSSAVDESKKEFLEPPKPVSSKSLIEKKTTNKIFCTYCGSQRINDNDLFCVSCGSRFDSQK